MQQTLWATRKFNFDFPVSMFPVIISRLQGTVPRIADLIQEHTDQELSFRPGEKWSIKQHIGHLTDLEELHHGRITDFLNHAAVLRPWDGTNQKTELSDHNHKEPETLLHELKEVRKAFISDLMKCSEAELNIISIHPRLNVPMRLVDMAFFVAEHDDHHIAKMWEIIWSVKK